MSRTRRARSPIPAAHREYVEEWVLYMNFAVDAPPPPASSEARRVAAKVLRERGYDISRVDELNVF